MSVAAAKPLLFHFPLRFKFLVALLVVITAVVGGITFTMANLFHADKKAYVHDLATSMAFHTSEEAESLLKGYYERLQLFSRVLYDSNIGQDEKTSLIKGMFEDFPAFVAVTLYRDGKEGATIYDSKGLEQAGLTKDDLAAFRKEHSLPWDKITKEKPFIINSTLNDKLPTFTIAMIQQGPDGLQPAAAVVRLEDLMAVSARSRIFNVTIMDSEGIILANPDVHLVSQRAPVDWLPIDTLRMLAPLMAGRTSATTLEYTTPAADTIAAFTRIHLGDLAVTAEIPKSAAFITTRELLNNLTGIALALLVGAAILGLIWARGITRPIERLSEATRAVGKGEFEVNVNINTRDEMGVLAGSFNQMAVELKNREQALQGAQDALVQSEKMSAFGQLSAGIAHEVKNPLAGILGYAQLSLRKVEIDSPLHKNLLLIEKETKRTKEIIENLMRFARQEKVDKTAIDITQVVQDAIAIVDHQLGINQVKVARNLAPELPRVQGNGNHIQQVLMNFMINAQQAMDGKPGTVTVSTRLADPGHIEISVADDGPGMSKDVQAKVFEPFFTTKPAGKGTGLGLSVSFGIIRDHHGEIRVESEPGHGAAFIITLPVKAAEGAEQAG